jgi:chemotaxis protein CheD
VGGLHVSSERIVLDTVLGSCISACIYDEVARVGGMNHFMLPESADSRNLMSARYGVYAMELLINELMKIGGTRSRFRAKVFGGGHVLRIRETLEGVPQRNIEFVRNFLSLERIPIVGEDVGGYHSRRVLFYPLTGAVHLKKLGRNEDEQTRLLEAEYLDRLRRSKTDGDATLF